MSSHRPTITPFDLSHLRRIDGSLLHRLWLTEGAELVTLLYATSTSRLWRRQDYDRAPLPGVSYQRIVGDVVSPVLPTVSS